MLQRVFVNGVILLAKHVLVLKRLNAKPVLVIRQNRVENVHVPLMNTITLLTLVTHLCVKQKKILKVLIALKLMVIGGIPINAKEVIGHA